MEEEYDAFLQNSIWDLVPHQLRINIVFGKWLFKHKFQADGSLERYKAIWVLRDFFSLCPSVDFDETFTTVPSPCLATGLFTSWICRTPSSTGPYKKVYCAQLFSFEDLAHSEFVCRLNKSLYDLKQALSAWYSRFAAYLDQFGIC